MKKLNSSDAWILQTVAHASAYKPASLQKIISTGDMLNHAIFTSGELQHGFYNLYQLRYIKQDKDFYTLTEFGKKALSQILNKYLAPMEERHEISKKIKASAWSPNEPFPKYDSSLNPMFFTLEEFSRADKKYHKEAGAILKNIKWQIKNRTCLHSLTSYKVADANNQSPPQRPSKR